MKKQYYNSYRNSHIESVPVNVVGGVNFSRYPKITAENTVNMMVSVSGEQKSLVPYAGHKSIVNFPTTGNARGIFWSTRQNQLIVVYGQNVFAVPNTFSFFLIGSLQTVAGPVFIAENFGNQIALVDGLSVYIWNYQTNTFTQNTDDDTIPSPNSIVFQDSYFIIGSSTTGQFQLSDPNDGTHFNPLQIETMQSDADQLQILSILERQLWVIGKKQGEMWRDLPVGTNFPYQRDNTLLLNYGILSQQTLCSAFGKMVWLGLNQYSQICILTNNGGSAQEIPNDPMAFILNSLTNPSNSCASLFQLDGHIIYQITFISDNLTFAYDFSSNFWYTITDENGDKHPAYKIIQFGQTLYFISLIDNKLYEFSTNIYTYGNHVIPRKRILPPIRFDDNRTFIASTFSLQAENGVNPALGLSNNLDPGLIDLSMAKDGGQSFSTHVSKPMNALGVNNSQIKWWKLGSANDLSIMLNFWSYGRFVILAGTLTIIRS